jgi:hypothetical protein
MGLQAKLPEKSYKNAGYFQYPAFWHPELDSNQRPVA